MFGKVVIVIGMIHFWTIMRGFVETYSIWQNIFCFPIPRIESGIGIANFDFIEIPLQDINNGSGFIPYMSFSLGSKERIM
jgi:hypothetical protein